jgi:hypothetical protein
MTYSTTPMRDLSRWVIRIVPILLLLAAPAGSQDAPALRQSRAVRVCSGGDVAIGTNLDTTWAVQKRVRAFPDPVALVTRLAPLFDGSDIALVNVEGAIGSGEARQKCARRSSLCFAIRQAPGTERAIRAFAPMAQVVGNVANNHARDAGAPGFAETTRRLGEAGVHVAGADTLATPIAVGEIDTVAVLGFGAWAEPSVHDLDAVRRHVERAAERYGRVIVTMHIGAEGAAARHTPDSVERYAGEKRGNSVAFSRVASEAGASLVIGHGPHVLRGMEWSGRALVAHSLGNLLTYGPFTLSGYNGRAAVLCTTLQPDGSVTDATLLSTKQVQPGIASPDSLKLALNDLRELSATDFPVTGAIIGVDGSVTRRP